MPILVSCSTSLLPYVSNCTVISSTFIHEMCLKNTNSSFHIFYFQTFSLTFKFDFTFNVIILQLLLFACRFVSRNLCPGPLACYVLRYFIPLPRICHHTTFLEIMIVFAFCFPFFFKAEIAYGFRTDLLHLSERLEYSIFSLLLE